MGLDSKTSASFFGHFDSLEDPRIERCQRHNLCDILFLAVCATIAGANDFVAMQKFGHAKWDWLKKFLELPNGIPSHDTLGRVFSLLDGEQFIQCFLGWVQTIHQVTAAEIIAVDGKTSRASWIGPKGKIRCTWSAPGPRPTAWSWGRSWWTRNPTRSRPSPNCFRCWNYAGPS